MEWNKKDLSRLSSLKGKTALVTGGCGFLGRHIVELLLAVGVNVRVFDIVEGNYNSKVKFIKGNLLSQDDVDQVVSGVDMVFHVASPSPLCNNPKLFFDVNVNGTKNVIASCRRFNVSRMVYTSSASVVYDGSNQKNFDESCGYPDFPMDAYTTSKLQAEKVALSSADNDVAICAVRPHGIFGPHDPHLLPALSRVGKEKKSKYMIGDGSNLVDFTFVGNVAYSHVLAAVHLSPSSPVNGTAYFITNNEPILFWDFLTEMYRGMGYILPSICMPVSMMLFFAKLANIASKVIPFKPTFTNQSVTYAGRSHYYNAAKAKADFEYEPLFTLEEAVAVTLSTADHLKNPNPINYPHYSEIKKNTFPVKGLLLVVLLSLLSLIIGVDTLVDNAYLLLFFILSALSVYVHSSFCSSKGRVKYFNEKPDLTGKRVVITGANKGIGLGTAIEFATLGATVLFACRSEKRARDAMKIVEKESGSDKLEFLPLDLNDMSSVSLFVSTLKKQGKIIDILVNNAGGMPSQSTTADGFDSMVQLNYLGHWVLTNLSLSQGVLSPNVRIIHVSSVLHEKGSVDITDLNYEKRKYETVSDIFKVYGDTKLMNVLFSNELHRRLRRQVPPENGPSPSSLSLHPGSVFSDFALWIIPDWVNKIVPRSFHSLYSITERDAAQNILYAALHSEMYNVSGVYIDNSRVVRPSELARHKELQKDLWEATEKMCAKYLK